MLFAAFVSIAAYAPVASAQSAVPTYYNWAGYEGNQTVYLTEGIRLTNSFHPSPIYSGIVTQTPSPGGRDIIGAGVGGMDNSTNGESLSFDEYYSPSTGSPESVMVIYIPVTSSGSANWSEFVDWRKIDSA